MGSTACGLVRSDSAAVKPAWFGYSSRTPMSGRTGLNPGLDGENIPHTAMNIAAITGPMTNR